MGARGRGVLCDAHPEVQGGLGIGPVVHRALSTVLLCGCSRKEGHWGDLLVRRVVVGARGASKSPLSPPRGTAAE